MGDVRYRVGRVATRVAQRRPLDEPKMLEKVEEVLGRYRGAWQIRPRGRRDWSGQRGRRGTADRLATLAGDGEVGFAWQFRPLSSPTAIYVIRKIEVEPPVTGSASVGSEALKVIHTAYFQRFPTHESWGIYNCRAIAGSTSWSQHAWGNAEDFSEDGVASEEAERWLFANRTKLPISELIGRRRVWSRARASEGWRALSSGAHQHLDHWHVSADPLSTGSPPCA